MQPQRHGQRDPGDHQDIAYGGHRIRCDTRAEDLCKRRRLRNDRTTELQRETISRTEIPINSPMPISITIMSNKGRAGSSGGPSLSIGQTMIV